jgi:hypothetical protein
MEGVRVRFEGTIRERRKPIHGGSDRDILSRTVPKSPFDSRANLDVVARS